MKRILLIDYSVMMHQSWHQMFGDNYVRKFDTEMEEYFYNLARNLLYLKFRIKADKIMIALDAPVNWRKGYIEKYYDSGLVLWRCKSEGLKHDTYYTEIDRTVIKFEKFHATGQWSVTTPVKAEVAKLDFTNSEDYDSIPRDMIKSQEVWQVMEQKVPYYKAHRAYSEWRGVTPKSEWKKLSYDRAKEFGKLIEATVVTVPYAEGDDVIAGSVFDLSADSDSEVVVCSVDQDLYQLKLVHPNVKFYNPVHHEFKIVSHEDARFKLICKIAGGDGSDNINGVILNGKRLVEVTYTRDGVVKNGKSTAGIINSLIARNLSKGITGSRLYDPAYDYLEKNCEDGSFDKNLNCVYLHNIPEKILRNVSNKVIEWKVEDKGDLKFADFGIDKKDRVSIMNFANSESEND